MQPPTSRPFLSGLYLGAVSAAGFASAFPSVFYWPLAFIVLAPLIVAAQRTARPARTALGVWLAWIPAMGYLQQFAFTSAPAGAIPLAMHTAMYPPIFVWTLARLHARYPARRAVLSLLIAPLLWTGIEVFRGEVLWHGYPWFLLGQPLIDCPALPELASVLGVYSMTAAAALFGAVFYLMVEYSWRTWGDSPRMWHKCIRFYPALVFPTIAGMLLAAARSNTPPSQPRDADFAHISVIQTNVPQSIKNEWTFDKAAQDFSRFLELTSEATSANPTPDLIVWPETMFPGMALNESAVAAMRDSKLGFKGSGAPLTVFHDALLEFQKELGVPMLIGAEAIEGLKFIQNPDGSVKVETESRHNSAFLVSGGEVRRERYDKMQLTPFGEVMPYISEWDWLEKQLLSLGAQGMSFDLKPGTSRTVFNVPLNTKADSTAPVPDLSTQHSTLSTPAPSPKPQVPSLSLVTPICFEAAVQYVCRSLVFEPDGTRRASLMVCLTNDGWFYNWRGGHENHLLFARWRCLELGTPMVRAANTGISCLIDAHGRIIERRPDRRSSDADIEGVLQLRVALPRAGAAPTLFARFGNWLGWTTLAAAAIFFVAACVPLPRRTSSSTSNQQPPTTPTP